MTRQRLLPAMSIALVVMATVRADVAVQNSVADDASRLVKAMSVRAGHVVADIGAGSGELTVALARVVGPAGRVYGTEVVADRVRAIDGAAHAAGLTNVTAIEGHPTRTNLPERCCDAVVVRFVYHHFKDPRLMGLSLYQSLKPGGLLAVIDFPPTGSESKDATQRADGEHHGVSAATVSRELLDVGFEQVAIEDGIRNVSFLVVVRRPLRPTAPSAIQRD